MHVYIVCFCGICDDSRWVSAWQRIILWPQLSLGSCPQTTHGYLNKNNTFSHIPLFKWPQMWQLNSTDSSEAKILWHWFYGGIIVAESFANVFWDLCNCISISVCVIRFCKWEKRISKCVLRLTNVYRNLKMCIQNPYVRNQICKRVKIDLWMGRQIFKCVHSGWNIFRFCLSVLVFCLSKTTVDTDRPVSTHICHDRSVANIDNKRPFERPVWVRTDDLSVSPALGANRLFSH